jgi:hypothetical protein
MPPCASCKITSTNTQTASPARVPTPLSRWDGSPGFCPDPDMTSANQHALTAGAPSSCRTTCPVAAYAAVVTSVGWWIRAAAAAGSARSRRAPRTAPSAARAMSETAGSHALTAGDCRESPSASPTGKRCARPVGPTAATECAHYAGKSATCLAEPITAGHALRATRVMLHRGAPAAGADAYAPSAWLRTPSSQICALAATADHSQHARSADVNDRAAAAHRADPHAAPADRDPSGPAPHAGRSKRCIAPGQWGQCVTVVTRKSEPIHPPARNAGIASLSSRSPKTEPVSAVLASVSRSNRRAASAERPPPRTNTTDAPAA